MRRVTTLRTMLLAAGLAAALAASAHGALVGYWTFDDDTINDSSGSGFHGTLLGGGYSSDVPAALGGGRSLNLTGGNHYAIIDAAGAEPGLDLLRGATVSAWMKGFPTATWSPLVSKRGESNQGWQLRRHGNDNEASWTTRGTGTEDQRGTTNINNANWKHLLGTYNGWFKSLYVDGVLESRALVTGNIANTDSLVVFGARDNSGGGSPDVGNFSQIMMDNVAIYNTGVTANQAAYLAAGGDPTNLPAPVMTAAEELPKDLIFLTAQQPDGTWNVFTRTLTAATWDEQRVRAGTVAYDGVPGRLASIHSAAEEGIGLALLRGADELFLGLTDSTGTSTLDGFNFATLGTFEAGNTSGMPLPPTGTAPVSGQRGYGFQWITGEPFTYQRWSGSEPNDSGSENIVMLRPAGWNDHNGGSTMVGGGTQTDHQAHALVEFDTRYATRPYFQGEGRIDPRTGRYYERIMTATTWDEARVIAEQRQFAGVTGYLATISDFHENQAVRAAGEYTTNWIGATDSSATSALDGKTMSGTEFGNTSGNLYPPDGNRGDGWVWVTGEPMNFRNWNANEPNNSGGEDAAEMRGDGLWNDGSAGWSLGQGNALRTSVVEYDVQVPLGQALKYLERKAAPSFYGTDGNGQINSLTEARILMNLPSGDPQILAEAEASVFAISFTDPQAGGGYTGVIRHPFLTDTSAADDDFAVLASGQVRIPTAGDWTFALWHDDHFELTIGDNSYSRTTTGAPFLINGGNVFNFDTAGYHDFELLWFERGGGAYLQLFAAPGNVGSWDPNVFRLVGDVYNGGLAVIPEPGTLLMGLVAMAMLLASRRRK